MNAEPRRRHNALAFALAGVLAALPAGSMAQEVYAGPEEPAPPHLATPAAPTAGGGDAPYARNWRDRFTPFEDPSRTQPARLREPLSVPLPPDLLANPADAQGQGGPAEGEASAEWACASHADAARLEGTQWALETLRADQPQAGDGAGPADRGSPLLTLPTAIHLALCHNPQVRATWSAIALQAAQQGQARSAYWPQVIAGIGHQHSRASYGGDRVISTGVTTQSAVLSWRLWDAGARSARTDAAQAQLAAALYTQDATIQKVLTGVLDQYAAAQAAQERLDTQRTLLPLAERNLEAARRRQQGGAGSGNDTLQAIAARARIILEQSRSEGELDKTRTQLSYSLGLPAGTGFRLQDIGPEAPGSPPTPGDDTLRWIELSLDDWLQQTRDTHPAIQAAKARWLAAQANLKAVQSDGLPTLDLVLAQYRNGRPDQSITGSAARENVIGVNLRIPLFDGFNTTYKVRAAQAEAEQKAIEYQATEQQTLQDLVQVHAEAKATLKNLRAARSLYAAATETALSTQRRYGKGAADILQLDQSLIDLQQAQLELARSQAEWGRADLSLRLAVTPLRIRRASP